MALPKAGHPISLSMRMRLIEGGDRRDQDLSKTEEVAAAEMIGSVKNIILSSTFSVSARHMLHTWVRIAY